MVDLIVIGAGPGGYEAAIHAGRKHKKVALFERNAIGGTCLNVGCIPTKTLLKSSHVLDMVKIADKFGVTVPAPIFSMQKAQERKAKIVATLVKGVEGSLKKSGVEVIMASASIKGPGKVEADGKTYETANILIATGSKPAVPPIPGIDSPAVLDSTGILKLSDIPESLVIIGGGVIGLEFACFFAAIGAKVTVVEMLPTIAMGFDADIRQRLFNALKKKGIVFHMSAKVTRIDGKTVHFQDNTGQQLSAAGRWILNATGRKPVMDGLGLENLSIDYSPKGIVTDEKGKTNLPGIWACGDVTGRCLLAHAATREGIVAVENMFGNAQTIRYNAIPSVVYTDPEVASVGKTEEQLVTEGVAFKKASVPMGVAGRFLVEFEDQAGTIKVLTGAKHGEILGIHMIGGHCSEHIFSGALMIESEMRDKDVLEVVFPHPTLSEALKEALKPAE
jgi:dihydrolipoamide dehydrogenase